MLITPIDEALYKAFCLVSNEMNDILETLTGNDFENDKDFMRLTDAIILLDEYCKCFTAEGKVSQRGEVPQIWNPNTIFEAQRYPGKDANQLTFDWVETPNYEYEEEKGNDELC